MADRSSPQFRLSLSQNNNGPIVRSNITSTLIQAQQQQSGSRTIVNNLSPSNSGGGYSQGAQQVLNATQQPSPKQVQMAKARMAELMQFWLALPETSQRLRGLVDEVAPQSTKKDADPFPPTSTSKPSSNPRQTDTRRGDPDVALGSVGMDDLPTDLGGFTLSSKRAQSPSKTPQKKPPEDEFSLDEPQEQQPSRVLGLDASEPPLKSPRGKRSSPMKSPRNGAPSQHLHPSVNHVVDELDAAHRAGALSPRAVSPNPLLDSRDGPSHQPAKSPLEKSLEPVPSFEMSRSGTSPGGTPHESVLDLDGSRAAKESPRGTPKPVTVANVAANSQTSDKPPHRSSSSMSTNSSNGAATNSSPAAPLAKVPLATLEQIPRFFFERGRPVDLGESLVDQMHNSAKPVTEAKGTPPIARGSGWKPPPTHSQADQVVQPSQRWTQAQEDAELQALGRVFQTLQNQTKSKPGARAPSAGRGRPGTAGKGELSPLQAMAQITTTAFGLPSLFTKLLGAKISPKGAALSQTTVKQFYDQHMARKTSNRRMFESLMGAGIASQLNQTSNSPAQNQQLQQSLSQAYQRNCLIREDFVPLVKVLLDHHPGLAFLKEATDFQSKYQETVILRIFYELDPLDTGKVSWERFDHSSLPQALSQVDSCEDINEVLDFFSYEHFYVLYCRFWELDTDKDFLISLQDLERYFPENTTNSAVIERIFSGCGRKVSSKVKGKLNYEDFVYFCLSEENKAAPRAIRYWFKVLDLDGDGIISGYELEQFYNHTRSKLLQLTSEAIGFQDVMCQVSDMLSFAKKQQQPQPAAEATSHPKPPKGQPGRPPTQQESRGKPLTSGTLRPHTAGVSLDAGFTLGDFLRCPQAAFVAFNMLTNVSKFVQFEQRDPFVAQNEKQPGVVEKSEWDRFCRAEYDRMAAEADDGGGDAA